MDYQRRAEIFSKEALTINDVVELTGKSYQTAAKIMRDWKRKSDRLKVDGLIHILDYFIAMGIDPKEPGPRYAVRDPDSPSGGAQTRKSVCF
jgi:hypothetical protein